MVSAQDRVAAYAGPRVDSYSSTGNSCSELRMKYNVDIREFVVLACINDTDYADQNMVCRLLGLSPTTVESCLERLSENGLVRFSGEGSRKYRLTTDGLSLIRKATK